jgi:hypothetical protein
MRRALLLAGLTAALTTQWLVVLGQDRAQDLSAVVVPLAKRESSAYVKAFNDRKFKDLTPLFTGARHGLHGQAIRCYLADGNCDVSPLPSATWRGLRRWERKPPKFARYSTPVWA